MKTRNVIFSLVLVLILFVFIIMKLRFLEPHRKLTLKRNPSPIKYSALALCLMDCYHVNANDVTYILKNGEIDLAKSKIKLRPCPMFTVKGVTAKGIGLEITISQCGSTANITGCYYTDKTVACNCPDEKEKSISYFKKEY